MIYCKLEYKSVNVRDKKVSEFQVMGLVCGYISGWLEKYSDKEFHRIVSYIWS